MEKETRWGRNALERMPSQLDVVRQVMLLAAQYESWLTLEELARKTDFPEPSIFAQLRHLRKQERGGFVVEKRRRTASQGYVSAEKILFLLKRGSENQRIADPHNFILLGSSHARVGGQAVEMIEPFAR